MKLPSLFKIQETSSSSPFPWSLPPCGIPKTLSFRAENHNMFTAASEFSNNVDYIETMIEGLKTEKKQRLLFEPGETSSILEEAKTYEFHPFKESCVLVTIDSKDPFEDFKKSMEEMVTSYDGIKDCDKCLEQLLASYLKVNEKSNHRHIIGAFFDLLISLYPISHDNGAANCSSFATSHYSFTTSPLSFCSSSNSCTSPCLSLLEADDDIMEKTVDSVSSSDV